MGNKTNLKTLLVMVVLLVVLVGTARADVVVDDFDSYPNNSALWAVWDDYYVNNSGAEIFLETDPNFVRDGNSLRFDYYNDFMIGGKYIGSFIDADIADLDIGSDWTVGGVDTLTLYFYGKSGNSTTENDKMWVELEDTSSNVCVVIYDGDPNDVKEESWHKWNIKLAIFDACGVSLANVNKIHIGFGHYYRTGQISSGGLGTVWFDDIRLIKSPYIYVDANAIGAGDGSSWSNAYNNLQDGLAAAGYGSGIQVAEGTYYPDANTNYPDGTGSRTATFQLISGVGIYGGFPSGGGSWAQRDWQAYPTILSGDLDSNDVQGLDPCDLLDHPSRADNSFHVASAFQVYSVVLEGFHIIGGNANGVSADSNGGGLYNVDSNITVARCLFFECSASSYGGGYSVDCGPSPVRSHIICCQFIEDCAVNGAGGGMHNRNSNTEITNCTFTRNSASKGGGMYNYECSPTITGCSFTDSTITLYDGLLDGGGMYNYQSDPNITNCTFSGNSANNAGGGIYNNDSDPNITNCILWGNVDGASPVELAQIYDDANSSSIVKYSCVEGLNIYDGNNNIGDNPLFLADIPDQVRLLATSPCIDAGDNNSVPVDVTTDIEGHPRITDGDCNTTEIVDMGAYEFDWVHIGDFAGGCDVDFVDFSFLGLTWLLEEGQPGYNPVCDIALPADSFIDEKDLKIFTDNWLAGM